MGLANVRAGTRVLMLVLVQVTGMRPSFLPKSIDGRDGHVSGENLHSGLSPLIECPCSDRMFRSVKNSSAILTSSQCKTTIATARPADPK